MRNILLGIQFFICWVFVAFTVALYMQAEKTESTLFNTLTEKEKANILSFSIDYMLSLIHISEIKVLDQYKIHTSLSEYYIDRITTGLPATVNYQGKRYPLTITKVVPWLLYTSILINIRKR